MRTPVRACSAVVVALLLTAHAAHAQGYIAPSLGVTLANASGEGRASFGGDLGWLSPRDPFGAEVDIVYAPSFFGNAGRYGDNSVTTVMLNVLLAGGHDGGRRGFGRHRGLSSVRPYLSGGVGVMHEVSTGAGSARFGNDDLGANLGVGVIGFMRRSAGVRADLRYFRNLVSTQTEDRGTIDFGAFHMWRASLGLVFAF